MLLGGARKFPLPLKQRILFLQNYAKKASVSGKKPRIAKKQTNNAGRNVLMELDDFYNNPKPHIGLAPYEDEPVTSVTQQVELPKQMVFDHKSLEKEVAKNLAGKSKEDLLRLKFDKTPHTPQEFETIRQDAGVFLKMMELPIQPASVIKFQRNRLDEKEKDLTFYLRVHGDTLFTHTSWIRGICKFPEGYQKSFELIKELRSTQKFTLDIAIYNSLLTGIVGMSFERIQKERDIVFALLKKDRLSPDAMTYTTIIDAVIKQKIDGSVDFGRLPEEQLDWCYTLIEESQTLNVTPQPSMYTSLIKGCVKAHDPVRAWKSFDHMRLWNCQPDIILYTEMLHVCSTSGEAERALDLFDELKQVDLYPTESTFNALLSCFRKRPDMTKNMLQVLQEMKEAGYQPDLRTFRHLLEGIQDGGDYNTANLLFDEILAYPGVDRSKLHWAYRALFWTYSKGARHILHTNKCVEITEIAFSRFLADGLTPTTEILNSVLSVYCSAPRIHRALEIREQFTKLGLAPTKATYYHLIAMFSHIRRMERAFDIFNQMKLANIQPTLYVYSVMLAGCAKTHFVMSGMRLLREMKEKGIALLPHHRHVIDFRRNLMQTPHLIREIDRLTGKDLEFVPGWKKVGGRHQRPDWRNVSKKERKDIAASPVLLPSSKFASGTRD